MGSIDLVLQVAPPPSVASGLQRIGRANHQVGGRSEGIVYPRTRTEVIDAAIVSEGMSAGAIEKTTVVKNPLDVLAQQTVAAVSMEDVAPDEWYATVCRCAPFSDLPRRAFDAVLGMLSGAYSSAELARFLAAHHLGSRAQPAHCPPRLSAPSGYRGGHHSRSRHVLRCAARGRCQGGQAARGRA